MRFLLLLSTALLATATACASARDDSTATAQSDLTSISVTVVDSQRIYGNHLRPVEMSPDGRTIAYQVRSGEPGTVAEHTRFKDLAAGTTIDLPTTLEDRRPEGYLARTSGAVGMETALYGFDGALVTSLLQPPGRPFAGVNQVYVRQGVVSRVEIVPEPVPGTVRFELATSASGKLTSQPFAVGGFVAGNLRHWHYGVLTTDGTRVAIARRRSDVDPALYVFVADVAPGAPVLEHEVVVDGVTLRADQFVELIEASEHGGNVLFRAGDGWLGSVDIMTGIGRRLSENAEGLVTRGARSYWSDRVNLMSWDATTPTVAPTVLRPFAAGWDGTGRGVDFRLSDDGKFYIYSSEPDGADSGTIRPTLTALPLDPAKPVQELVSAPEPEGYRRGRSAVGPGGKIAMAAVDRYEALDLHTGQKWQGALPPGNQVIGLEWSPSGDALGILFMTHADHGHINLVLRVVRDDGAHDKIITTRSWSTSWLDDKRTALYAAYDGSFLIASEVLRDPNDEFGTTLLRAKLPPGPSSPVGVCAAQNDCDTPTDVGVVRGNVSSPAKTGEGSTSQFLRVYVNSGTYWNAPMKLKATLTPPPGVNFDLYVYGAPSPLLCASVEAQSTNASGTDSATMAFKGDRYVTVEVRHVSGTCDPSKKWTLKLEGNPQ